MREMFRLVSLIAVVACTAGWAQQLAQAPDPNKATPGKPAFGMRRHMMFHGPGKWWKDTDTVKQVGITDGQASQIEQIFVEHRMKLIDWVADLQKQELKLETILDADQPEENQVSNQVDQVVAARGKLEKENALMMLDMRRVLTPDQWKKLQSIRGDMAAGGVFFHRFVGPPHAPGDFTIAVPPMAEAPAPPPPPQMD
jgi:periplasmic protein CpxP/Spy